MAEPSELPIFDENDTNTIPISEELKDDGFSLNDRPASGTFNSWFRNVYKWVEWFQEKFSSVDDNIDRLAPIDSIASLRAITYTPLSDAELSVLGYYSPGDGGGGQFYWDATSTDTDDNGIIIKVTSLATGRWIRLYTGPVMASWFDNLRSATIAGYLDIQLSPETTYILPSGQDARPLEGCRVHGPKSAVVQGATGEYAFRIYYDNTTLEGFTIDGNGDARGVLISGTDNTKLIDLSIIDVNHPSIPSVNASTMTNFEFRNNVVTRNYGYLGININESEVGLVTGNQIYNNGRGADGLSGTTTNPGDGLRLGGSTHVIVEGNYIAYNNRMGFTLEDGDDASDQNIIANNTFIDNGGEFTDYSLSQIHIETSGRNIIEGNTFNIVGITGVGSRAVSSNHAENDESGNLINANNVIGAPTATVAFSVSSGDIVTNNRVNDVFFGVTGLSGENDIIISNNYFNDITFNFASFNASSAEDSKRIVITGNVITNFGKNVADNNWTEAGVGGSSDLTLYDSVIVNNRFEDTRGTSTSYCGVLIDGACVRCDISGNTFVNMERSGIEIANISYSTIANNTINDGVYGINILSSAVNTIHGNSMDSQTSTDGAMKLTDIQYTSISENKIWSSDSEGISITGSTLDLKNNHIINNNITSCTNQGILITPNASDTFNDNIITGNRVFGCSDGLKCANDGNSDYNIITSNNLRGNTATSDIDAGTWGANSLISNNINP